MHYRNFLSILLVALVLVVFLTGHAVLAQQPSSYTKITSVSAPSTASLGQPVTVSVTVSYSYTVGFQMLVISIMDQTENGYLFPTTAISGSCSPNPPSVKSDSVCFANTSNSNCNVLAPTCGGGPGSFTVSFTLTAPNQAETWNLCVFSQITQINLTSSNPPVSVVSGDLKVVPVTVT